MLYFTTTCNHSFTYTSIHLSQLQRVRIQALHTNRRSLMQIVHINQRSPMQIIHTNRHSLM